MRNLLLPLALLLAACPEQVGQQCPPNTSVVGQYTLVFAPQRVPGECTLSTDGGHLTVDNRGAQAAMLCLARAADGGPQLDLIVAGQSGVRTSELEEDGGFHFLTDAGTTSGTACSCDVDVVETIDGFLLSGAADAGFSFQPDGGPPLVTGLSGNLTDHLTGTSSPQPCLCTFPCTVTYLLSGTRF
ncbi:MAG TPA: hypothetical protein VFP52_00135 [Myxococcales bacterium]|nr:hypothetical protein [Myxococcales bacterium]